MSDFTPYHAAFYPIFLPALSVALLASFFAGRAKGCLIPSALLTVGVLAFWAGAFFGAANGFDAWQKMPNPPDEAFSDTAVVGALIAGWLPGLIICLFTFGVVRLIRLLVAKPKPSPESATPNSAPPVESGNPYQGPQA